MRRRPATTRTASRSATSGTLTIADSAAPGPPPRVALSSTAPSAANAPASAWRNSVRSVPPSDDAPYSVPCGPFNNSIRSTSIKSTSGVIAPGSNPVPDGAVTGTSP